MTRPTISVCIVLFHTDPALVEACLDSVDRAAARIAGEVEIVIVDNSSNDDLAARFAERADEWVHMGQNAGFAVASNRALAASTGMDVLFLNPDASIAPPALQRLLEVADDHPGSLIGGWLVRGGQVQVDALMHWWTSTGRVLKRRRYARFLRTATSDVVTVEKVSGGAMMAKRELLEELGPFDERFFLYGEDADLSQRALRSGGDLLAVRSAEVQHIGASSQESHSELVERARADAAIRLASYHLPRLRSLLSRVDLLFITLLGLVPGLGRSSGSKRGRVARLKELRRWGWQEDAPRFSPGA